MTIKQAFSEQDMKAFEPAEKVGLLATVNPQGLPHISLITSLQAKTPTQVIWGQFCIGLSKQHVQQNPKTGFLIMSADRELWRGKATWTHLLREGDDYTMFNEKPMFRYNSYFGINTVHYMDLVETTEKEPLPVKSIVPASILTKLSKFGAGRKGDEKMLSAFGMELLSKLDSLAFLAAIDTDGYPRIIPLLQCQPTDPRRLVFTRFPYSDELRDIKPDTPVAIFAMTLKMESVLVRGRYHSQRSFGPLPLSLGAVDIDWVYNSMPPSHGQIYPPVPLEAVEVF